MGRGEPIRVGRSREARAPRSPQFSSPAPLAGRNHADDRIHYVSYVVTNLRVMLRLLYKLSSDCPPFVLLHPLTVHDEDNSERPHSLGLARVCCPVPRRRARGSCRPQPRRRADAFGIVRCPPLCSLPLTTSRLTSVRSQRPLPPAVLVSGILQERSWIRGWLVHSRRWR